MAGGQPFGELAGVVGVFHFHQAGQLADDFDAVSDCVVELLARRDVIADGIEPVRDRGLEREFGRSQVSQKIDRQFMSDELCS